MPRKAECGVKPQSATYRSDAIRKRYLKCLDGMNCGDRLTVRYRSGLGIRDTTIRAIGDKWLFYDSPACSELKITEFALPAKEAYVHASELTIVSYRYRIAFVDLS